MPSKGKKESKPNQGGLWTDIFNIEKKSDKGKSDDGTLWKFTAHRGVRNGVMVRRRRLRTVPVDSLRNSLWSHHILNTYYEAKRVGRMRRPESEMEREHTVNGIKHEFVSFSSSTLKIGLGEIFMIMTPHRAGMKLNE